MNSLVTSSMAKAALQTAGFYQAVANLDQKIKTFGADSPQAAKAASQVAAAQHAANLIVHDAIGLTGQFEGAMGAASRAAELYTGHLDAVRRMIAEIKSKNVTITVDILQHGGITLPGMPIGTRITSGLAEGGTARRGVALVGEEGPELMWMRGGEQVVPAHQTKALMHTGGEEGNVTGTRAGRAAARA